MLGEVIFTCVECGKKVREHPTGFRDHCNFCLFGLHVDRKEIGDCKSRCRGALIPIGMRKKDCIEEIIYKCRKCKKFIYAVPVIDDDRDKILELWLRE